MKHINTLIAVIALIFAGFFTGGALAKGTTAATNPSSAAHPGLQKHSTQLAYCSKRRYVCRYSRRCVGHRYHPYRNCWRCSRHHGRLVERTCSHHLMQNLRYRGFHCYRISGGGFYYGRGYYHHRGCIWKTVKRCYWRCVRHRY